MSSYNGMRTVLSSPSHYRHPLSFRNNSDEQVDLPADKKRRIVLRALSAALATAALTNPIGGAFAGLATCYSLSAKYKVLAATRNPFELPSELVDKILGYLPLGDLNKCAQVSRLARDAANRVLVQHAQSLGIAAPSFRIDLACSKPLLRRLELDEDQTFQAGLREVKFFKNIILRSNFELHLQIETMRKVFGLLDIVDPSDIQVLLSSLGISQDILTRHIQLLEKLEIAPQPLDMGVIIEEMQKQVDEERLFERMDLSLEDHHRETQLLYDKIQSAIDRKGFRGSIKLEIKPNIQQINQHFMTLNERMWDLQRSLDEVRLNRPPENFPDLAAKIRRHREDRTKLVDCSQIILSYHYSYPLDVVANALGAFEKYRGPEHDDAHLHTRIAPRVETPLPSLFMKNILFISRDQVPPVSYLQMLLNRKFCYAPLVPRNHCPWSRIAPVDIRLLCQLGADPNEKVRVNRGVRYILPEELNETSPEMSYLMSALHRQESERVKLVRALLEAGANPSPNGETPLCLAASLGSRDCVRLLIDHGADANITDPDGRTPSQIARSHGHEELADHLIIDHLLRELRGQEGLEIVRALLEEGVNPNIPSLNGETPLCVAASLGRGDCVRLLLEHGADIRIPGIDGKTPSQIARSHGHEELANFLVQQEAPSLRDSITLGF